MTIARERPVRRHPAEVVAPPTVTSPPRVVWWACLGALFVAVQVYSYVRWFTSGDATPTPTGADEVPTSTKFWCISLQFASLAVFLACIVYVVRQCRAQRRLTFDAILLIGWLSVWWQDPIINYVRPTFFYNAYLVNLGSWTSSIPGWSSPNGHFLAEPLFAGSIYGWFMLTSLLTCAAMRWMRERRPTIGLPGLLLTAFVTMFVFDLVLEACFVRTGVYAYGATIHEVSLWGAKPYHFPLYEPLLWGSVLASVGVLRYFCDDRGRTAVERGVDRIAVGTALKNGLRTLAVIGFMNLMFLVIYNVPIQWIGLHVDTMPDQPTYLRVGLCGPDTPYPCAGPDAPIYLRGQEGPGVS